MRLATLCLAFGALLAASPAPAATTTTPCDTSLFQFAGVQSGSSLTADTRFRSGAEAGFNCAAGLLWSHVGVRGSSSAGDAALRVSDRMTVTGVPAGTRLTFTAALHVTGYLGGEAQVASWITAAGRLQRYAIATQQSFIELPVDTVLRVTVDLAAGDSFELATMVWADGAPGWAALDGALSFAGLPPAAHVTSCRGYGQPSVSAPDAPEPGPLALLGPVPDPARGAAAFTLALDPSAPAELDVLDVAGRRVQSRQFAAGAARRTVVIDGLPGAGVYLVRVRQRGGSRTRLLVRVR